jgi:glutamate racemase
MTDEQARDRPIGVFDSGVGGLTVLRALRRRLPHESMVYLGDSARVPYGTKSPESVIRYASQATDRLVESGIKLLVVACNTASAVAMAPLRQRFAPLPVIGVVEPGAAAAVTAARRQHHLVLATESTVTQHAYQRAICALAPGSAVEEIACSLFVSLAEEGWTDGPIPELVARQYLAPVLARPAGDAPETVVLGCTHFPLLAEPIRAVLGPGTTLVDSAHTTAEAVADALERTGLVRRGGSAPGSLRLLATDGARRFAAVGSRFLGEPLVAADVEVIDL